MNEPPNPVSAGNNGPKGTPDDEARDWQIAQPETLPKPTVWPAVLALGACLLAAGVVTSWIVSLAGFIFFAAAGGGWIAAMRREEPE